MSKKLNSNVRFSAWFIRFIVSLAIIVYFFIFIMNSWNLVTHAFTYSKNVDETKLVEHTKDILTDEDVLLFYEDEFTNEDVNKMIDEVGVNKVNDYIMIELLTVVICLMLSICKYWNILTPLLKSNLKEPFTDDNIKGVSKVIKFEVAIIIFVAIVTILENILFDFIWKSSTLTTSATLSSFGSISTVIIFIILEHILKTGKEKIEKKN